MILSIIGLSLSLILNGFLVWYSISAIKKLQFMSNSFEELDSNIQSFGNHLKAMHELEMYYGDQTLQNLIRHSKELLESFGEIRKDYEIFNGDIDEDKFFEEEKNEDDTTNAQHNGKVLLHERS